MSELSSIEEYFNNVIYRCYFSVPEDDPDPFFIPGSEVRLEGGPYLTNTDKNGGQMLSPEELTFNDAMGDFEGLTYVDQKMFNSLPEYIYDLFKYKLKGNELSPMMEFNIYDPELNYEVINNMKVVDHMKRTGNYGQK